MERLEQGGGVSIHAPTRGATEAKAREIIAEKVSIHAPTRGATKQLWAYMHGRKFQSTHPRGVRLDLSNKSDRVIKVSIHAPTRGATSSHLRPLSRNCFNPRTHEGCDMGRNGGDIKISRVSIHAPTRGATRQAGILWRIY